MAMEVVEDGTGSDPASQPRTVSVTAGDRIATTPEATPLSGELEDALAVPAELDAVEPAPAPEPVREPVPEPRPEPIPDPEPEPEPAPETEPEPAATAPASPRLEIWEDLSRCESGKDWAIDTGNGYYGGLQFDHPSWHWAGGDRYSEYPHQATKAQQIEIAERLLEIHPAGWGAWPACSAQLGLG